MKNKEYMSIKKMIEYIDKAQGIQKVVTLNHFPIMKKKWMPQFLLLAK